MKTGLLWVTYGKDLPWFEVSARSFKKYGRRFDFAKCVVPNPDVEAFKPHGDNAGISIVGFDQHPEKGMLHHEIMVCCADLHFPEADVIFHIDADTVFACDTTPERFLDGDKPILSFMDFSTLLNAPEKPDEMMCFMGYEGRKMDFFRGQYSWKFAADFALGWSVDRSTMQTWPLQHLREVYPKTRALIASRHGCSFEDYVFSCRNEFPQSFCEFETLGGVAHRHFNERYHWRNILAAGHLPVHLISSWSHGGFDRPHNYAFEYGGTQTPRQLFTRLGIL